MLNCVTDGNRTATICSKSSFMLDNAYCFPNVCNTFFLGSDNNSYSIWDNKAKATSCQSSEQNLEKSSTELQGRTEST